MKVVLVVACLVVLYWKASGGNHNNEVESHRTILAECWNAIERKVPSPLSLTERQDRCRQMERGFRQMYGSD